MWLNCLMVDISPTALGSSATSDIFQILRDGRPRTRTELARVTGLARSTVGLRIDSLLQLGLIGPADAAPSTGGRPSSQFALTGGNKVVLAVDIGATHVRIAVSDLVGRPLSEDAADIPVAKGPEEVLHWVIAAGDKLVREAGRSVDDLLAIGVGLPGPVEHSSGRPINPPIMPGWDNVDVPERLQAHFHVPVLVDNDVNIMALGEREVAWPEVDHLIFVKVATGIGAGVISRGMLQRGAQGVAGDIGHVRVYRDNDAICHCGNVGCIEALASGPALAKALTEQGLAAETSQDVVELVRAGNPKAIQAVRQAGRDLGEILNACISLINPSVIVLGGAMARAGEHLIAGVREVVYARSMPLATQHLQITQSSVGANAAVLGASILAIHHVLSPESVEAMVVDLADAAAR
jgi:predicted NBD/HSP70 family sugar kinase